MGDGDWNDMYDYPQVQADPSTDSHRLKYGILEDGYNKVCSVVFLMLLSCFEFITQLPSFLPSSSSSSSSYKRWQELV